VCDDRPEGIACLTSLVLKSELTDYVCQYPVTCNWYPLLLVKTKTRVIIRNCALRSRVAEPPGSGHVSPGQLSRTRTLLGNGSGVATCLRDGGTQHQQPGARTPQAGPGPPRAVRTPEHAEPALRPGGVRSCHISHYRGHGRESSAGSLPTHRIKCGCLRRALPPQNAEQLWTYRTVGRALPR
jgi:hypothetical protein